MLAALLETSSRLDALMHLSVDCAIHAADKTILG